MVALAVLLMAIGAGAAVRPGRASGDPAPAAAEPSQWIPTAQQTHEALESSSVQKLGQAAETDPKAAEELPHRDLGREEALELTEGVFGAELEGTAGIYDELEPTRYLSDYAAVVPAGSLAGSAGGEASEAQPPSPAERSVLLESTLPLRTEDAEGQVRPVDLGLTSPEGSGGELQPQNPLAELAIPAHLGEGIELGGVGIEVVGAAAESTPTNVEERYAFYPNVAENTDLVVAPTPSGAETMTDIRSAEAPRTTTYRLSLPSGASLESGPDGVAEVVQGGRRTMLIPPPSATDAAGKSVPAQMQVEGDELKVAISPEDSTQFPVMVDPNYIYESWCWSGCGNGYPGWSGSTNTASYEPVFGAQWDPSHYGGLDLTSHYYPGAANAGTHADWAYWVPRFSQDMTKYGTPPSTFVSLWMAEGVLFLPFGNYSNYPAQVIGLIELGVGWAPGDWVHYGGQGELAEWGNVLVDNPPPGSGLPQSSAVKGADEDLVTYEYEPEAKFRDAFIGSSTVQVVDVDAPKILELQAPKGWITGPSASIGYGFEDTGLGVWSSGIGLPGEVPLHQGWGTAFGCTGTNASPCPRVVKSSESGARPLTFAPNELPTGKDQLEVVVGDPLWGTGHIAQGYVTVQVDHTPPEVELSGALTEQEKLGTLKSEYPLTIKATDGTAADPQSGVAKVEVKVDGKTKQTWNPGCAAENCSFSGSWTLKTSEYTEASHEVEVLVTDAAGIVSEQTVEVDLGEAPPQTSFTSPHPSHETTELKTISFKATRGGAPVEGATFRCSLDGVAASPCTSPDKLPEHFETGLHTFTVAAVDKGGKADPTPATWRFESDPYPAAPANEKLVFPETGKQTASYYTLEAEWGANPEGKASEGVTGVTFQMQLPGNKRNEKGGYIEEHGKWVPNTFETVPAECTVDGQGRRVSWPLPVHTHPGHNSPVYLRVRGCPVFEHNDYPEKEIQFRAVFDGSKAVAGASAPATTEFVSRANANRVATDATETVGPASVDLLTGAFTMSHTDVSIPVPGYEANLEFSRTYSSTVDRSLKGYSMILGGAWQPGLPLESESEGQAWSRIVKQVITEQAAVFADECWEEDDELTEQEELENGFHEGFRIIGCPNPEHCTIEKCEEWETEPFQPHEEWIELLDTEGAAVIFEITPAGAFVAPEYSKELKLTAGTEGTLVLAYPNGSRNIFVPGAANEWSPKYVSFQATPSSMRLVYATGELFGEMKLVREIAPSPVSCEAFESEKKPGCRTLKFEYQKFSIPGHYFGANEKLSSIEYYGPSGENIGVQVAQYQYEVKNTTGSPCYGGTCYEQEAMLVAEMDPRDSAREWYAYDETPGYGNLLKWADREGQEPWGFEYEYGSPAGYLNPAGLSHLKAVTRAGAKTTLAYGVPTHGPGAPYAMGYEDISKWGQTDLPVDATAIFPPNHAPAEYPPHEYAGATVHYMDPEGYEVNTASPSPPGVAGAVISTTETDIHGNVVRELDPQNRLAALAAPEPVSRSHELDTHSVYSANGNERLESWGPLHQIRLASGELVEARQHTVTRYDEGETTPPAGTPPAYLPTKETVAVVIQGKEGEVEPTVTETRYNWPLRKPEETIVDPGGLNIRSVTRYNGAGQVEEVRQPKGAAGGTAGDRRTIYWSAGTAGGECENPAYANLPCKVVPVQQEAGSGRPELLVKRFRKYNYLDEPEQVSESPGGGAAEERKTTVVYDRAGRQVATEVQGGGVGITKTGATETSYSPTTGMVTEQRFSCAMSCTGFDNQSTKTTYNSLGQVEKYEDADGNKTETKYDAYGRPSTITDGRGTETLYYDEASGLVTSMEVSGVGTFTATYDADGDLIERGLPNGLTAKTTYNQVGEPMKLAYTKTSACGESCTWYEESLERSGQGQILASKSSLVSDHYAYDKAGRLTEAQETPPGGQCTSRLYRYDADSNRETKTTRTGVGGACATSGGAVQKYEYDNADRLKGPTAPTYDAWGRITALPAEFAGGNALTTEYFANDMVAKQTQNKVTNTFQLDATGRQRQREQTGGVAGIEVFHYDGPGDSPSWTSLGSTWSRSIAGLGGELAAVQESNGTTTTTTFRLTDLHGDVVASASSSSTETKLLATFRFSEFGEPVLGSAGRYGWLGGKSRRTELSSGVIQMGARSYIPQLGRFLTPDAVPGGSANAYDYVDQDPVNVFDIGGLKPHFSKITGVVKAGVRIRSPKNSNGRDSYGKVKARFYVRVNCGGCEGTDHLSVSGVKYQIEKVGTGENAGHNEVIKERAIRGPNLNKGPGEQPFTANNWSRNTAPIEASCINGDKYQVTITVTIGIGASRIEPYPVSTQVICGEG